MSSEDKIIIGISIGDINGIGSEIILKTFEDSRMLEFCTPVIFASVKLMSFFKKHFEIDINFHGIDKIEDVVSKKNKRAQCLERTCRCEFWGRKPNGWRIRHKIFESGSSGFKGW